MLKRMPRTIAAEQSLKSGLFKLRDIAACAYGNEEGSVLKPGEKTKKDVYQRLLPYSYHLDQQI